MATRAGINAVPAPGGGVADYAVVTVPAGTFEGSPVVVASVQSTAPQRHHVSVLVDSPTQFRIFLSRDGAGVVDGMNVHWIATDDTYPH